MRNTDRDDVDAQARKDGAKGGAIRAARLTPAQRSESARLAAEARWATVRSEGDPLLPKETHDGELEIGGLRLPCAVLDSGLRVLPTRAVTRAFGGKKTGSNEIRTGAPVLPPFLATEGIKKHLSEELLSLLRAPVIYRPKKGGRTAFGYDGRLLPRICRVVLAAARAGDLKHNQNHLAASAALLVDGFSEVGIIALIDEATGYQADRAKGELAAILQAYIAPEMLPWIKHFPDEFFKQVYILQGWEMKEGSPKKHPQYVGKLINDWIYKRLPDPVLPKLRELNPATDGRRKHKHFQFLTDETGIPHLDKQIAVVVALMRASKGDKPTFEQMLIDAFPVVGDQVRLALRPRREEPA